MSTNYPARHRDLQALLGRLSREMPGTTGSFAHLHKEAMEPGALNAKFKELMALGIAVAIYRSSHPLRRLHRVSCARCHEGRSNPCRDHRNLGRRGDDGWWAGDDVCVRGL
jgi:hypothetical protein